ncbi:MAG: radical SAM protein [Clostridiales bacterium]|nr:radical SAM protein [Clostridiales bacterium]
MTLKQKIRRALAGKAVDRLLDYVDKNPDENLLKLVDKVEKLTGDIYPKVNFKRFREGAADKDNVWRRLLLSVFSDVDRRIVKNMLLALGLGGAYEGTKTVRENREKYNCNIPWIILLDPTSACNLRCKGCWSAEYGHHQSLSYEELDSIVTQGKALGTHFYMFTGGEPLIRKDDIIKLCEKHNDCAFLAYTNATLIDQKLCDEVLRVGNLIFAISIEGSRESNDSRRGEGSYEKSIQVMDLLRENKCLFGISVCYTRENVDAVTSEDFVDLMISKGCKFGLYFNYMPIGQNAVEELIPSPEQRTHMYSWLRKMRNSATGKPMFVMDFQDDGEFVGGCIAGGRNYFHINSAGDIEPCVFIHFSDSNIRTHTLLQALKNPLFQAFYHNQPFNENHLRPCPMLENPQCLRSIIKETGAKSTDLIAPEDVDTVCARCDRFAGEWAPQAEKLWQENPHPNPKTQYYKDRKDS